MVFGCVCMGEIKLILFSLHSYKKDKNNKQKAHTLGLYIHLWIIFLQTEWTTLHGLPATSGHRNLPSAC